MLTNYVRTAWRNLWKYKGFSLINVGGLALGMSVCLLVRLIIADQRSYDQFHGKKDQVYRVLTTDRNGQHKPTATSPLPLGDALKHGYPIVAQTASLVRGIGGDMFVGEKVASGGGYFADANLFQLLDFHLEAGNPATCLQQPFSLVITEAVAAKLFGRSNPVGRAVRFNDTGIVPGNHTTGNHEIAYGTFTITGVLKQPVGKTHLPFELLASLSTIPALAAEHKMDSLANNWQNVWNSYTYVLLQPNQSQADLQSVLSQVAGRHYPASNQDQHEFQAQSLNDITPSAPIGNMTHLSVPSVVLWVLVVLGLIVLLSACLNYTNLTVARSLSRAKEVGIRKVAGATRRQVLGQFIVEAVLVSLCSLLVSLGLLAGLQVGFFSLWLNQYLHIDFTLTGRLLLEFIGFGLAVGLLAGLLPSIYLSALNPIQAFRGGFAARLLGRLTLRKVLLTIQFCVSLIFITSTVVLYFQLDYLLGADYGFSRENMVNIKLYKPENYDRFAHVINTNKAVLGVSASAFIPAAGTNLGTQVKKVDSRRDSLQINYIDVDHQFVPVWGLKLVAGQNLPTLPAPTGEQYVLINEKMVADFRYGSNQQAVGQKLLLDGNTVEIVGVVRDFHFRELINQIGPLLLRNRPAELGYANVKISGKDPASTVAYLASTWKRVNPNTKFDYTFLDNQLNGLELAMTDIAKILGYLAFLAVLISCLGLLGMAAFTAQSRVKEVGVRKVLGASETQVALLLSRGFFSLLVVSVLIATPLAYLLNSFWLNFFAYRIALGPGVFLLSILLILLVSLLTIFSQTARAAWTNPVKSLRSE